jgi:hypothetical protein
MLSRIAALLPLYSHVRVLVSAARSKESSFCLRFNGDGTTFNPFGTVNIGGTIIIDATGAVGTYTVAADCMGTLSITGARSFNIYVGPGAQQVWTTEIRGAVTGLGVGTATRVP